MRIEGGRRAATVLVVAWAVLLACVLGIGWLLTHPLERHVEPWDDSVVRWFADHRTSGLDVAADAGSKVADTLVGIALTVVLAAAISRWQRSWRPFAYYAVLVGGTFVLYLVVTALVPRDRPPVEILDPGLVPDHSFPSGHVATAVVVYCGTALLLNALVPRWRRRTWPLLLVPLVVAPSRLYQGAHHPTDVLTSLLFASAWLAVVARVLLHPPDKVEA
ncbi:phosphatase PAP2 family protein [Nocardioides oleivorans]|uniref:Phosphatase PAP2 family protein n=1 Tax=Nocardioides oleivorans TaxID=273676 RepID=A0A4Q2S0A8_9ACTN|nr:phosphatase PAP2 family protein [Nocardioides oleivorans]RYB93785.1 phosphatase PAP2 family protein [Nocardioides oleivorans]